MLFYADGYFEKEEVYNITADVSQGKGYFTFLLAKPSGTQRIEYPFILVTHVGQIMAVVNGIGSDGVTVYVSYYSSSSSTNERFDITVKYIGEI